MNHPDLFAGFNTAPNNGDEVDGAGLNYPPVSPHWVLTTTQIEILIITEEMFSFFVTGCPDVIIRGQPNTVVFPRGRRALVMRAA